jgi:DNA-binding MarR family transcriptional regulator
MIDLVAITITIKQIEHVFRQHLEEEMASLHITMPQWSVLHRLVERPGASGAEIARLCFITPQATNLILVRLQERGLVERSISPRDSRQMEMLVTEQGKQVLRECNQHVHNAASFMLQKLSETEKEQFLLLLTTCFTTLTDEPLLQPSLDNVGDTPDGLSVRNV